MRLAIIPARGGSKRIPRKNIKSFFGKPIIAFAIEAAIKSNIFDTVMVSTDDEEIARIAIEYGAKVPFIRSKENSDDFSGTDDVILEVINEYQKINKIFDIICCIYPVNPFIENEKLIEGYNKLINNTFDSVFSAVRYSYPIQRSFRIDEQQKMYLLEPNFFTYRSQDLPPTFHDAAQFYWSKTDVFLTKGRIWTDNTSIVEINELKVQDIDNETDWKLAELKYKLLLDEKQ
jgi:pseudaminic acid cytidylyltransferase